MSYAAISDSIQLGLIVVIWIIQINQSMNLVLIVHRMETIEKKCDDIIRRQREAR